MRKKIFFLSLVFAVFYLSSCSAILIKPEDSIGDLKYKITDGIKSDQMVKIIRPKQSKLSHWIYLSCDYIFGCYMRCEGPLNSCMKVATLGKFNMKYIMTKKKGHPSYPKCHQYC